MSNRRTPTQPDLRDEPACRAPVRPGPTVENIIRGASNMRAHSDGGDDDADGGDDANEGFREDGEAGDDVDDIHIWPLGKTAGRGKGHNRGAVRGRSIGRGDRGGVSDDDRKSATYWSTDDQLLLVRCKREQEMHLPGLGHNYGRMRTKEWKRDDIAKRMVNVGRPKDVDDCMKKWDNLFQNYKEDTEVSECQRRADFFRLSNEERKEYNFKSGWTGCSDGGAAGDLAQTRQVGGDVEHVAVTPRGTGEEGRKGEEPARASKQARAEKKKTAEDGEPLVNRVRKGGMEKTLVDRAKLWVDDKSFRTLGEGRRLYNIVNDTHEYLVAIASGLPLPKVPRSVAMPRSNVTMMRVTDAGQLQGALRRASKCQNVAMRVLHGWVFKSGCRERGYTLAFQYVPESMATEIARAMWHGEEWSNEVTCCLCAHVGAGDGPAAVVRRCPH
ncbi:hypothetical protein CBR_g48300 [Chara braunii]|uniref:Myb-like domain-containing protein n=1 Tax=Chara braunii TaxID=69332 RepID=A0A388K443_CHABU|nr:hypothetical protein CBR_g48300 [Chara braunii]|eukprot:GBG64832.1 hypothetical protein CBR_g48300 [Chara braunii]